MQDTDSRKLDALALALPGDPVQRGLIGNFPFPSDFEVLPLRFHALTFPTSGHISTVPQELPGRGRWAVLPQDQVPAESQLIVEYSARRRRDDLLGLGLLTLIAMLSFTGIVELSRDMHPIRFLLLLTWAWSCYRVLTRSLLRVRFAAAGIESRGAFGKTKYWQYDDLAQIRRTKGPRGAIQLGFRDGSVLKLDFGMTHSSDALALLQERVPHLTATLA